MKVKICGITRAEDAVMCEELGADAIGFVHYPGRHRSMPLAEIDRMCEFLGPMTTKVLVCAPANVPEAIQMAVQSSVNVIQTYSLGPQEIEAMRRQGVGVIRAVPPTRSEAIKYSAVADALLFEQGVPGTGEGYDYSRIPMDCSPRSIIAGGLNIDNMDCAKALKPYALDVSTGVERLPGRKDHELVKEFIRRCKS